MEDYLEELLVKRLEVPVEEYILSRMSFVNCHKNLPEDVPVQYVGECGCGPHENSAKKFVDNPIHKKTRLVLSKKKKISEDLQSISVKNH